VGYPGYWLLLGKPDEYQTAQTTSADESIHGVAVEIPTNHREIPGSTPGRYNLQIEIASWYVYIYTWLHIYIYIYVYIHKFQSRELTSESRMNVIEKDADAKLKC